jgi:hypothetical protein
VKRAILAVSLCFLALSSGAVLADTPILIFDPLPTPLKLPPGLIETLPLNKTASFFGDAFRVVDCADPDKAQVGTCGNQLFGGLVMTDSHLTGNITIQFFPTADAKIAHFVVSMGVLQGDDGTLSAPQGYSVPVKSNVVADAMTLSSGDLDLTTGYAANVEWNAVFSNTALLALSKANPNLSVPSFTFPGTRGHAWASFAQRPDGLLDFYFRGSTFLPLGNDIKGSPVRFPLPYCSADWNCASVQARGTSLHPHLYLDTRESLGFKSCAPNCPDIPTNKTQVFTVNARFTAFGDDFDLRIPELGGAAPGRSELQGRFEIQFGPQTGNTVPFTIQAMVPEGLFAEPPVSPLLGPNFRGVLMGANQILHFPTATYPQHKVYFANEIYNLAQGMIDLDSGQIIGEFVYPMYIDQTIIEQLIPDNNGRVSLDPFFVIAMRPPQNLDDPNYAFFEKGANGQTMFRANLFHRRTFETYCFPTPKLIPGLCYVAAPGSGSNLNIFAKLQAAHLADPSKPGSSVMSDSRTFTSSAGDVFSYNFKVACNPIGQSSSLVYTNNNSGPPGGTFTLQTLASVSCTNSKTSSAAPGSYDHIAVTGFGSWSKDAAGSLPRFLAASFSTDPADPYGMVIVFSKIPGEVQTIWGDDLDVNLSSAENKPPVKPIP